MYITPPSDGESAQLVAEMRLAYSPIRGGHEQCELEGRSVVDKEYASHYRELHKNHWWFRSRKREVLRTVAQLVPAGSASILDVGCGDGVLLPELEVYGEPEGVEPLADIVSSEVAKRYKIHLGEFGPSFRPGLRYDLLLMLDVLEHLPDPVAVLRRARELLNPRGAVVITVPAFVGLWTTHDDLNHHVTRFSRRELRRVVTAAGLSIRHQRYYFHWVFFAKLGVRLKEIVVPTDPSVPRVPCRLVNCLLYAASRIESVALRPIAPVIPFGGSVIAVVDIPA